MPDRLVEHFRNCPDRGVGYDGIHGLGCGCSCICGPEGCDDNGDPDEGVVWCAYCAALDPSLPCPNERTIDLVDECQRTLHLLKREDAEDLVRRGWKPAHAARGSEDG